MFKMLACTLLLLAAGLKFEAPAAAPEQPPTAIEKQHSATHKISFLDMGDDPKAPIDKMAHCSATAVGPHALLTAQHCFADMNTLFLDNDRNQAVVISAALIDGHDHVIYIVQATFESYASIEERDLVTGEPVHQWGAPEDLSDVYRGGYFRDLRNPKQDNLSFLISFDQVQRFVLPDYPGDSGAGIFDASGHIVAVVTGGHGATEYSPLLSFTPEQIDIATTK